MPLRGATGSTGREALEERGKSTEVVGIGSSHRNSVNHGITATSIITCSGSFLFWAVLAHNILEKGIVPRRQEQSRGVNAH